MSFNWLHYKYLNPDLDRLNTSENYKKHYLSKGRIEKRNCNLYMMYPDFNYKQYALNYPDLHKFIDNKIFLENHWLKDGIKQKRDYKNILIPSVIPSVIPLNLVELPLINILLRTTYRPSYFNICIKNILSQSYKNIRIICCYDDTRCLEYLNQVNDKRFEFEYIMIDKKDHYKYNLYLNTLLDKVEDGWIIFLDDDDMFTTNQSLITISSGMTNENNFIFWSVKLGKNIIIHPPDINNIKEFKISGIGFCFNSKYKKIARWKCKKNADFSFISDLFIANKFNPFEIVQVLTQTQHSNYGMNGTKEK